jgi:hypothetical protein
MEIQTLEGLSLESPIVSQRRPYFGRCHCGFVRYIAWITLPAEVPCKRTVPPSQLIRKCNCTICHKTGFVHVRLANSLKDFALLSPLDPIKELSNYKPTGNCNWLFCKTCGVRCFMLEGEGEVNEIDLVNQGEVDLNRAMIKGDGTKVKVFQPKAEGWKEEEINWFRINALTLEAKQDGLDMREWQEKKWIQYVNALEDSEKDCDYGRPYIGGHY